MQIKNPRPQWDALLKEKEELISSLARKLSRGNIDVLCGLDELKQEARLCLWRVAEEQGKRKGFDEVTNADFDRFFRVVLVHHLLNFVQRQKRHYLSQAQLSYPVTSEDSDLYEELSFQEKIERVRQALSGLGAALFTLLTDPDEGFISIMYEQAQKPCPRPIATFYRAAYSYLSETPPRIRRAMAEVREVCRNEFEGG